MNLKVNVIYCSLLAGMSMPAFAEDFNNKLYLGLGAGVSNLSPDIDGTDFKVDDKQDFAGKIYLGMDFAKNWGGELYYADLGAASLSNSTTSTSGDIEYQVFGVSALYHFYNNDGYDGLMNRIGWDTFAKIGMGSLDNSSDLSFKQNKSSHLMLGLGTEIEWESGLAVRLELETFDSDMQMLSVGALWRFGLGSDDGFTESTDIEPPEAVAEMNAESVEVVTQVDPVPNSTIEVTTVPEVVSQKDTDGDGISDLSDVCPGTATGIITNSEGCDVLSGVIEGVEFKSSSAKLVGNSKAALDTIVDELLRQPNVRIAVMAHTDSSGSAVDNLELSKKRVITVVRYLMSRGVSGKRLRPEAFGENEPLSSNATPEGRQANRRIEVRQIQ